MAEQTPRINASILEQFTHRTVRILGKVTQLRGEEATIDAGGQINVHLNREAHLTLNHAVELIGKVQADLSVRVLTSTDFGDNIGMHRSFDFAILSSAVLTLSAVFFFFSFRPSCCYIVSKADRLCPLDFSLAEAVVDATHRHSEIFYTKE
ncbi:hypothetical protein E4T39_03133 [Aureobasidium subglaciale]|nr:hypothetical protein E4T39_03133 [Aureobasidium subglaciale]